MPAMWAIIAHMMGSCQETGQADAGARLAAEVSALFQVDGATARGQRFD